MSFYTKQQQGVIFFGGCVKGIYPFLLLLLLSGSRRAAASAVAGVLLLYHRTNHPLDPDAKHIETWGQHKILYL
jgi:hypothetical protein